MAGDFNPLTLQQIEKYINDVTPRNPFGRRISQRVPQKVERGVYGGKTANAIYLLFSRISESAVEASRRFSEEGRRAIEERKKEALKGWAIATGNWHTDLSAFTDDKEPFVKGTDSKVYTSKNGGNEKLSNLAKAIKNVIIYGKEEPTEHDILRRSRNVTGPQATDGRTNQNGVTDSGLGQGDSNQRGKGRTGEGVSEVESKTRRANEIAERSGEGAVSDEGVTMASDPVSKAIGEPRYGRGKKMREYAERQRRFMVQKVQEIAQKLNLDNVEIVTDASTLSGKRAKAKGYFNPTTGKIVIVIPNHASVLDVEETVLHEAVAHYGLRKLFGKHFDTFLDNVYESADPEIRKKIAALAAKNG